MPQKMIQVQVRPPLYPVLGKIFIYSKARTLEREPSPTTESMADSDSVSANDQNKVEATDCKTQREEIKVALQQRLVKGDSW